MTFVRPRLTDHHGVPIAQEAADFAIPFLDEDIPLSVDPFLLWKSPSLQDQSLHSALVQSFNRLGHMVKNGKKHEAVKILVSLSECEQVGLGFSQTRAGKRMGQKPATDILTLFEIIPQVTAGGFSHFEEIQLLVDNVSKDRVSDIACNYLMSFLIDFTMDQCTTLEIPTQDVVVPTVYDFRTNRLVEDERVKLPTSPTTGKPILLVPKRWLRAIPWLNFEDYVQNYYLKEVVKETDAAARVSVLNFNRQNYDCIQAYTGKKEREQSDCKNDPLFSQLPIFSVKKRIIKLAKLPTGNQNGDDKQYERLMEDILPSMLYPHLDFADSQVRTDSGSQIRDLVFYNNRSLPFLNDIFHDYGSKQLVFEIKNVKEIEREHINQLNRYLNEQFGKFGVLVTRSPLSRSMWKNTVDLWAGQRRCIIAVTDEDVKMMSDVFETKQRLPIEVINKKFVEFIRACPS